MLYRWKLFFLHTKIIYSRARLSGVCIFTAERFIPFEHKEAYKAHSSSTHSISTLTKLLCVMHTLISSQSIRLIRIWNGGKKHSKRINIYGKQQRRGKHLQIYFLPHLIRIRIAEKYQVYECLDCCYVHESQLKSQNVACFHFIHFYFCFKKIFRWKWFIIRYKIVHQ